MTSQPSAAGRRSRLTPWRRSLRARLVGSFLLLSAVTVALVGASVYARASDDLVSSVFERLGAVAEVKADSLNRWIDEQRRNVVFIGAVPGFGDDARLMLDSQVPPAERAAARDRVALMMSIAVRQTSDAEEILVLDLDGTIHVSTRPEHEGKRQADEPYFVRGSTFTSVLNAYPSALTGQVTITVSTPLFDQSGRGRRVGVLAAHLNLERIDAIVLERTGLGDSGSTYLVGTDHRFLHARLNTGLAPGAGAVSAGIDAALAGNDGQALYLDYQGRPVIGLYRWLDEHDAALIVELGQDEALAPARQLAILIAAVGLASAVLLAFGIWLIARRVTRPILALAATASRVAAGDLDARADITAEDEVGTLAQAFGHMTAQLRENVATLERRVVERTAELSAALDAQREAEQQYRLLVEELPLAVYIDPPGDPMSASTYVSPPIEALFGYPAERWLEVGFFESIVHPDDRERITTPEGYSHENRDRASGEYRLIAADGRTVWVRDDNTLVRDANGEPKQVLGFFVDVTRQVEATTEVRRQKQYFESLVAISPVAVVTMDRYEVVSAWNPAATALFGYRPDEAIGHTIDELIFAADQRAEGAEVTRLADETGRAQLIGHRRRKDGATVDVEIVLVPLVIEGEATGYYAIYHDITELQAARRDADSANQAKSAFLAAMSHEIRTPMNAVIGMSGLLLHTSLDADQRDYAESISVSAEALLTIINDILDFSKIEAGRFELESRPFDLGRTIRGAVDLIRPLAAKKGLELRLTQTGENPPALLGDAGRLRQIILNLLSNATKFTESGEVEVIVATASGSNGAPWSVAIGVRDTGIGISAAAIGRLFESFSQADSSIARRYGGTGLGLAISRRLAELMGGSLTARSSGVPGEGTRFDLALELTEAPPAAVGADAPGEADAQGAEPDRGLRILLAEDNAMNQKLALRLLAQMGLTADIARNGLEAVEASGRSPYDVILMDVQMPELDGLDATRRIRETPPARRPWIVAMTASAMEGDRDACLAAGMDDYVSKPIRPDALRAALAAVPAS